MYEDQGAQIFLDNEMNKYNLLLLNRWHGLFMLLTECDYIRPWRYKIRIKIRYPFL